MNPKIPGGQRLQYGVVYSYLRVFLEAVLMEFSLSNK